MMQMRHTAHELRVTLDHVLHGGEATAETPQNSQDESMSFLPEPEAEMGEEHNIPEVIAQTPCLLITPFLEDCSVHLSYHIIGEQFICQHSCYNILILFNLK